jgi:hypothetical protein
VSRIGSRAYDDAAADARDQVQAAVALSTVVADCSRAEMARRMQCTPTTLTGWAGGYRDPTVVDLARLAAASGGRLRLVIDRPGPAAAGTDEEGA